MSFSPLDTQFEARVRTSFARQRAMDTIGATLARVEPGIVEVALTYRADLTQQHGFLHAGIVATILDSACGYAAFSLMAADVAVLTVEYKINLLRPAQGDRFIARGEVVRAGQTITVCSGAAFAYTGSDEKQVATMLATVFAAPERDGLRQ
ncbi:MAG TPA: PaaI family thioesterase [Burkholderiaceae bacterium]|nr:PaaI family thioesterase [Burkholderiaceae bacterium]